MPTDAERDAQTRLVEELWKDPESRASLEQIIAKKYPAAKSAMPHLVAREEGQRILDEVKAEREALRVETQAVRDSRDRERWQRELAEDPEIRLREEEIPDVEALMAKELIGSPRAAARLLRQSQQVASSRGGTATLEVPGLGGAGGDEYKGLMTDPDKWARDRATQVLNDFARGQGARWA